MRQVAARSVRRLVFVAALASVALGAGAGPAAAYSQSQSGLVGPFSFAGGDSMIDPMAGCGYHDEGISNWIWLDWVRVKGPLVYAADRNSNNPNESRRVTFQLKIQRHLAGSSDPWKVVASSKIQSKRAYENSPAVFSPIKRFYTPKKNLTNGQSGQFRAMVVIKWIKNNGTVEGTMKVWPSFYNIRSPYGDFVSANGYCAGVSTDG